MFRKEEFDIVDVGPYSGTHYYRVVHRPSGQSSQCEPYDMCEMIIDHAVNDRLLGTFMLEVS